jgi:FtsP/CotA-like multicopper oxidase with cupredoxin domain
MPEGLYWYHPHVHGEVQAQMLMGLSGAIVVEGPSDDARRAAGIDERLLIVRQTQDRDAARTPAASMTSAGAEAAAAAPVPVPVPVPASTGAIDTTHELLCTVNAGIDGLSVNDTPVTLGDTADDALAHLRMTAGRPQYWRVLNAATDAFLALALVDAQGRSLRLQVVARDGVPLQDDRGERRAAAPSSDALPVPPAGRIELLAPPLPAGTRAWLVTRAVDTGCAGDRLPERRLARVESAAADTATAVPAGSLASRAPAAAARSAAGTVPAHPDLFAGLLARPVDHRRVIAFAEYPRPGDEDRTDFYIVERRPGAVLKPYERGDAPAITVRAGTTEEWVIENWTQELHTFHIHQLHFRVLAVDGVPVDRPDLLDVVEIPYATATGYRSPEGPVRPGRVTVKLAFPDALAGDIPFHCHLVDHEDNGMMAVLRVLPAAGR